MRSPFWCPARNTCGRATVRSHGAPSRLLADRVARLAARRGRQCRRRDDPRRGRPQLPRRLRRRDGDVARALPPASRRGRAAAGRRALVHVPLLVPQRPDAGARRGVARHLAARRHLVLLQLVGLGVRRVGDPAGTALLAAAGQAGQDRPDLALAVVPRLDTRRALALGLQVARVLRADPRQVPRRARAERGHPPAPAAGRGGDVGRARARGRDRTARTAERRSRRDRAGDGRLGRGHRAAAGLHGGAAPHLRPPRRPAGVRRDDHGLRSHGRVVRGLPLARRDARHHHVREGRDERHRAVLGRARERRRGGTRSSGRPRASRTVTPSRATRSAVRSRPRRSA